MWVEKELLSVSMEQFEGKVPDYNFNTLSWMEMNDSSGIFLLSILLFIRTKHQNKTWLST